jgi:hypothetical protein
MGEFAVWAMAVSARNPVIHNRMFNRKPKARGLFIAVVFVYRQNNTIFAAKSQFIT